jgi:hypothetical protein
MKNNNFNIVSFRPFFVYRILPLLLSLAIFFLIYKYQNNMYILCDDNGKLLYELKMNLTVETANYRRSEVDYVYNMDMYNQLVGYSPASRSSGPAQMLIQNAQAETHNMRISLDKIRLIEDNIRIIKPDFRSAIIRIAYPRIAGP